MTFNTQGKVSFGKFFGYFRLYWNHSQRRNDLGEVYVFVMLNPIFNELKSCGKKLTGILMRLKKFLVLFFIMTEALV